MLGVEDYFARVERKVCSFGKNCIIIRPVIKQEIGIPYHNIRCGFALNELKMFDKILP